MLTRQPFYLHDSWGVLQLPSRCCRQQRMDQFQLCHHALAGMDQVVQPVVALNQSGPCLMGSLPWEACTHCCQALNQVHGIAGSLQQVAPLRGTWMASWVRMCCESNSSGL